MDTTTTRVADFVSATEILREDHRRIKALFREFQGADENTGRSIAARCLDELQIHSTIEEKLFYPRVRKHVDDKDLIPEFLEAHHIVDRLIMECRALPFGRRFNAKFQVIIDSVLNHIKDEEQNLLPSVEASGVDLAELGRDMALMKYQEMGKLAVMEQAKSGAGLGTLLLGVGAAAAAYFYLTRRD